MFFKSSVLDGPLGKTQYYAIQVEFQVRGSPHIHPFIWILNAPKFAKWIDEIVASLEISKHDYKEALSISDDNDFQIRYKRPRNLWLVNNYFCDGLVAREANIDI